MSLQIDAVYPLLHHNPAKMDFATWWLSQLKFGPVTELCQEINPQFEMWAPLAKIGFPKDILKNTHSTGC